tara:strand:+ start:258 stop:899 length:642 start_codon:yes stop_codon:yes gene_type:complete
MNNGCLNNKVLPYEPGYCDCCFSENINVKVCPSNNKCEYAMCEKCIKNLEKKTKTNKCPACREEIITIKDIVLEEPVTIENNVRITWRINVCFCCYCIYEMNQTNHPSLIAWLMCLQHCSCCIYNYFRLNNNKKKSFTFTIIAHIILILIGRISYALFYNENSLTQFWCVWYLFIGRALIGIALIILSLFIILIIGSCLWNCCCIEDDCSGDY